MTEPGGGCGSGQQVQAKRPGRRALRDRDPLGEVELQPGAPGFRPQGPAGAGEQPRRGGAVALRDAPGLQHVRGAVRTGVAAVGAQAHPPSALVEALRVPGPEPGQPLVRAPLPTRPKPKRRSGRPVDDVQLDRHALVAGKRHPQLKPLAAGELAHELDLGPLAAAKLGLGELHRLAALLLHHDPLGDVNEPVAPGPFLCEERQPLDQQAVPAGDANRQRTQRYLDRELTAHERGRRCALLHPHPHDRNSRGNRPRPGCDPVKSRRGTWPWAQKPCS